MNNDNSKIDLQSNIAKAKGLGSIKEGTSHFMHQRITALILIPLVFWFCFSLAFLPQMDYLAVINWMKSPINSILLIITLLASFYHLQLGMQVIIEDYVSSYPLKLVSILAVNLSCIFLTIMGVYSVLKVSL
jgi:succinate dehydrogenase / fumarate reductase, membrane anchor subunit